MWRGNVFFFNFKSIERDDDYLGKKSVSMGKKC